MNWVKEPCSIVATQIGRFIGQNGIKLTFKLTDLVWYRNIIKDLVDLYTALSYTLLCPNSSDITRQILKT